MDVADLGHEDRSDRRADPVEGLDGVEPDVVAQPVVDDALVFVDLAVEHVDELQQALDLEGVGGREPQGVEPVGAGQPPQVAHRGMQPVLGQHGVDLGLQPRAQRHQLGPLADHLPQPTQPDGGDPRLG